MKRLIRSSSTTTLIVAVLVLCVGGSAMAAWLVVGSGNGSASAARVNQGNTPAVALADGGGVRVTWVAATTSDNGTVDAYEVRRYPASGASQIVCDGPVTALSCTDTTVTPGTYTYTVLPLVGTNWRGEESGQSAPIEIVEPPTAPTAPTNLAATASSPTQINLTWEDNSDNETSFVVERLVSATEADIVDTLAADVEQYTVADLECATEYTFRVVAVNDEGESPSGTDTATTAACAAPGAPSLTLTPGDPSNQTSAEFRWTHTETSGVTFTCTLDGTIVDTSCTSPKTYTGLTQSRHEFSVVAVKKSVASAPAEHSWLVDSAAPSTSDNTASIGNTWRNQAATVTLSPSDPGTHASGVLRTYYTTNGTTPTTASPQGTSVTLSNEGTYSIKYFSVDNAGNSEPVKTASTQIRIDKTAPTTSDNAPTTWVNTSSVTVALTRSDSGGSGAAQTYYTTNGTDPTTSSPTGTSVTFSSDGTHTLKYRSTDHAGNLEAVRTATVRIDTVAPSAPTFTFPTNNAQYASASAWNAGCGTATGDMCGTASDARSGVARVELSIKKVANKAADSTCWDGSAFANACGTGVHYLDINSTTWSYSFDGLSLTYGNSATEYSVTARVYDRAGNVSLSTPLTFTSKK